MLITKNIIQDVQGGYFSSDNSMSIISQLWSLNFTMHLLFSLLLQDDPCFLMHFDTVRPVKAVNCAAKYCLARCLVALSDSHQHSELNLRNFDWTYIKPTSIYSNRGDCMVLMRICFYAFNLVCLSLCPVPQERFETLHFLLLTPHMKHVKETLVDRSQDSYLQNCDLYKITDFPELILNYFAHLSIK